MRARSPQLPLTFHRRGGRRDGAGRKPAGAVAGVSHRTRPELAGRRHPVHATLRLRREVRDVRSRRLMGAFRQVLAAAHRENGRVRVVHYSVQRGHIHLLVEAEDRAALSRGLQGLSIRLARRLNRELGRTGKVFADRFHARPLRTPLEAHRAIRYVLLDARHHAADRGWRLDAGFVDAGSSAEYFDGWREGRLPRPPGPAPVEPPRTWMLARGWLAHGPIGLTEVPGRGGAARPRRRGPRRGA